MKRLILIIVVLGLGLFREAQAQSYFNRRDPLHSFAAIQTSVVVKDGKYYTTGLSLDSNGYLGNNTAYLISGIKYVVYDEAGNKVRDTIYQRSHLQMGTAQGRSIEPWFNTLQPLTDGGFILAAFSTDYDSPFNIRSAIIKLDTLGRCTMFREYEKPFCQSVKGEFSNRACDLKPDGYGGWLLLTRPLCHPGSPSLRYDYALTKLDSAFNVVWEKQYGNGPANSVVTKIVVEPDGYLLAGGRNNQYQVTKNFIHQAQLIKTDTAGVVQWTWLSDAQKKIYAASDVVRTADGGYVYCGLGAGYEYQPSFQQIGIMYWQSWIEKLDVTRNVVWSKTLSEVNWGWGTNELTVLRNLPGGDIAVAGGMKYRPSLTDSFTQGYGQMARLAPDGTLRWQRKYRYAADTFEHTVHDMKPTPDGGYVLVGQSTDQKAPYNSPTQRGWIIKVDSNGCASANDPQCWPTAIEPVAPKANSALVYPNPATSILNVIYQSQSAQRSTLHITDLLGREVLRAQLTYGETPVDIALLHSGLYLWRIAEGGLEKAHGKFVKE